MITITEAAVESAALDWLAASLAGGYRGET